MDWYPNEDAILHFADAIFPRIAAQMPNVTLAVVGRNPSARLRDAVSRAGIIVTGTVDDVRPYIDEAALYIVPLRAGGGTRLKIFEALAMGKAVVSTSVGAEGLAVTPGRDIAIADQPETFASTVLALLRDDVRRAALGHAGRQLVQRRYSWAQVAGEFEQFCQSAARIRRATSGTALALAREQSSS
jgi:glycosyltransferase involved in cell wall biosynthesis